MSSAYLRSTFKVGNPGERMITQHREDVVRGGVARGQSDTEIARVLGVTKETVARTRKRLGLQSGWSR